MEIVEVREKDYVLINDTKVVKRKMWDTHSQKLENGISIHLDRSFGSYQVPIRKNAFFCNNNTIVYNCGNHLVLYDILIKKQKYIIRNIEDQPLTAMNFFTNSHGEISIAVALKSKSDTLPQVKLYNSGKSFNYSLVHSQQSSIILDVAFFLNMKFLITLTTVTGKGFMINIFKVHKEKLVSFLQMDDVNVKKIEVFDKGTCDFLIFGNKFCKVYSFDYQEHIMDEKYDIWAILQEALGNYSSEQIAGCVWITEANVILIASYTNKIYQFKNFKYIGVTEIILFDQDSLLVGRNSKQTEEEQERMVAQIREQQKLLSQNISVSCMTKLSRGVAIGFQGIAMLSLYELNSSFKALIHKGNFKMKEENIQKIHSIDISPDDMFAVINVLFFQRGGSNIAKVKSDEIYAITEEERKEQLGKLEIYLFNLAAVDSLITIQKEPYEPLFDQGVHKGSILDLCICPTRKMLVSACEDKTIKFIDFGSNLREIFSQFFHENPLSIAIHPLSIQFSIGFKDGLKVFYILDDELKHAFTNITKPCTAISYSNGGHLLAAGNYQLVTIYSPYDFQILYQLNGHAAALKGLEWIDNDLKIISTCQGGVLNVWDFKKGIRLIEYANKSHKLNAVTYDLEFDMVVCACSDNKLRVFKEKGLTQVCEYDTSPCQFTCITIDKRFEVIIFGTNEGSIRIFLWPFWATQSKFMEYLEIPIHQSLITSIKISHDFQYLITASEDNCIFISRIREYVEGEDITGFNLISQLDHNNEQNNNNVDTDQMTSAYSLNSLCLSAEMSHQIKKESIKELEFRLQNSKTDVEDEKEKWEDVYSQRIKALKEKHHDEKKKQKQTLSNMYHQHEIKCTELKQKIANIKGDLEEIEDKMNQKNSKDLISFYQNKDHLTDEYNNLRKKYEIQVDQAQNQYAQIIKKMQHEYDLKFGQMFHNYKGAFENVNSDQAKFNQVFSQEVSDFDVFFTSTKDNLKKQLLEENTKTDELRSSNSKYHKEIQNYKERQIYLLSESQQLKLEIKTLLEEQQSYKEKQEMMTKQLNEKEEIINSRESQVKILRSKNVHLQNFQKVYDFQVTTLKEERLPLNSHFTNTEKHLKNVYSELLEEANTKQKISSNQKKKEEQIKELKEQLAFKQSIIRQTTRLAENFEFVTKFLKNLVYYSFIKQLLDMLKNTPFLEWPKKLQSIYDEFFSGQTKLEKVIEQSFIGANLKELKKDQFLEQIEQEQQYLIGQDLKGQRDFLAKSLVKVGGDYEKVMESRNDAYLKVQNMNTLLINECNKMRDEKTKLKEYLGVQKKAYREVKRQIATQMGINFNDIKDNEDNFLQLLGEVVEDDEEEEEKKENDSDNEQYQNTDNDPLKNLSTMITLQKQQQEEEDEGEEEIQISRPKEEKIVEDQVQNKQRDSLSPFRKTKPYNLVGQSVSMMNNSQPSFPPLKNFTKRPNIKTESQLPFAHYQKKHQEEVEQQKHKMMSLSVTEKKTKEKLLIQDLLKKIEVLNENDKSYEQTEKLKEKVSSFLIFDRKDTVGPLLKKGYTQHNKSGSNLRSRKQISQASFIMNSPTSKSSTQTGFKQNMSINLSSTQSGGEFFKKMVQSTSSSYQNQ